MSFLLVFALGYLLIGFVVSSLLVYFTAKKSYFRSPDAGEFAAVLIAWPITIVVLISIGGGKFIQKYVDMIIREADKKKKNKND